MVDIHSVVHGLVSTYGSVLIVYLAYSWGYNWATLEPPTDDSSYSGSMTPARERSPTGCYLAVAGQVALFTLFLWASYGTHVESSDPPEPYGGGNTEIVEDFTPTRQQRNSYGLEKLITLELAALYGVYRGRKTVKESPIVF